jgi:hypothetical protein
MTSPEPRSLDDQKLLRLAKLFDLRTFIGALFSIFGVLVTIQGLVASRADVEKAADIRLALWVGLSMLVVGLGFIGWMLVQPPEVPRGHSTDVEPGLD